MLRWFRSQGPQREEKLQNSVSPKKVDDEQRSSLKDPQAFYPEQRTKIKTDLLVHDLKVPLAVIEAGITSLLSKREKYGPITQAQEKVLLRALRNVKVTQTLVADIMELGRASMGIINKEVCKISYLVTRALAEIMDLVEPEAAEEILGAQELSRLKKVLVSKGIYLEVPEEAWEKEVVVDIPKVSQILRNLLTNAIKYRKQTVELLVDRTDHTLKIEVKDDGEGIPEEYHKRIFECYFQLDQSQISCVRGHGLGLAGVMVLLEEMGGSLSLKSSAGLGATFIVELPLD
ncbi:MAG: sensor histidine kinase [Desulfatiglandales bacterium]